MDKNEVLTHEISANEKDVADIRVVSGTEAYNEAMMKEPPSPFQPRMMILFACCLVGFFASTINGYDGSLLNNLLNNPAFLEHFHGSNAGIWAGIVTSMYQIGSVTAIPFIAPVIDKYGRKGGLLSGALFVVVGTIVQGVTVSISNYNRATWQFTGGRFLLGFGVSLVASAGPMYVVEVSHPAYRGPMGALYNTFWFTGAIVASGAARGALNYKGAISWLLPVWLQLLFSGLIFVFTWFMPESPRWLYVNGKQDKTREFLTIYHGNGNPDSVWVRLQLDEYERYLEMDGADKRWWDYRVLFNSRGSIYRLGCNVMISLWGQWAGNNVLSYFLSAVLDTAGVSDPITKQNIALGLVCLQFVIAISGALCVDLLGRRFLLLFTNIGCALIWVGMIAATSQYAKDEGNSGAAKAVMALIYIFGIVYSFGFTPLQALYPVEVLSFEMRAKGMAFSNLAVAAGGLLGQFAWPVALEKIQWKTYIIFAIWCAFQAATIYFLIPETRRRTLEELDDIFAAPNPVKASLQKKKLGVDVHGEVVTVETTHA